MNSLTENRIGPPSLGAGIVWTEFLQISPAFLPRACGTNINTQLHVTDLWTAPVEVGHLLAEWRWATSQLSGPDAG